MADSVTSSVTSSVELEARASHVGAARRLLRDVLTRSGADDHADAAALALSEIVTNAFVHAGTGVTVTVRSVAEGARVEVEDGNDHLPAVQGYAVTAGTGRGLRLVDEVSDRWGSHRRGAGKVVWFEVGTVPPDWSDAGADEQPDTPPVPARAGVPVTLRNVPLLMHRAWQEHAAALLREYLLHVLDEDSAILDRHAEASEAMRVLSEQLPATVLLHGPETPLAGALEPEVTADEVVVHLPEESVAHFATLDDLLSRAIGEAKAGRFLGPPTQPEIDEMRVWFCAEVARQAAGDATATPWLARTDVRATLADLAELRTTYASLGEADEPLLATDEASIIVAASPPALEVLGYDHADDLLGRRVIVVVPERYHQAHITGTTLNATNGRDVLLGVPLVVPMVRADGSEVPVEIEVRSQRLGDLPVFVARFRPVEPA